MVANVVQNYNHHKRQSIPPRLRDAVMTERGWICHICGEPIDKNRRTPDPHSLSLDHVVPVALGGTNDIGNLAPSHLACNVHRQTKPLVEHRVGQILGNLTTLQMLMLLTVCKNVQTGQVQWRAVTNSAAWPRRRSIPYALLAGVIGISIGAILCLSILFIRSGIILASTSRRRLRTRLREYVASHFTWEQSTSPSRFTMRLRHRQWTINSVVKRNERMKARERSRAAYQRHLYYGSVARSRTHYRNRQGN